MELETKELKEELKIEVLDLDEDFPENEAPMKPSKSHGH